MFSTCCELAFSTCCFCSSSCDLALVDSVAFIVFVALAIFVALDVILNFGVLDSDFIPARKEKVL